MTPTTLAARAKSARIRTGFTNEAAAAARIGCSRPLVIAWENGSAKSIGGKYLLAAAKAYKVRPEWLADGLGRDEYPWTEAVQGKSHAMTLDPAIVAAAQQALKGMYEAKGRVYHVDDVARFVQVYGKYATRRPGMTEGELIQFGAQLADVTTPQGAGTDERSDGVLDKGTDKGNVARRVRRKA